MSLTHITLSGMPENFSPFQACASCSYCFFRLPTVSIVAFCQGQWPGKKKSSALEKASHGILQALEVAGKKHNTTHETKCTMKVCKGLFSMTLVNNSCQRHKMTLHDVAYHDTT